MGFTRWLTEIFGMSIATFHTLGSDDQEELYERYTYWAIGLD